MEDVSSRLDGVRVLDELLGGLDAENRVFPPRRRESDGVDELGVVVREGLADYSTVELGGRMPSLSDPIFPAVARGRTHP